MPGFRLQRLGISLAGATRLPIDDVRNAVAEAVQPGHFFIAPPLALVWEHVAREEIPWELFHGRLLERTQTREQHTFESWNVFLTEDGQRSAEPLLSVKLDGEACRVYVVRAIHCYAWEGYDAGDNVFLSRETKKWVRELTGQIDINCFADVEAFHDEIICLLFHAVVGTSRLPLISVESPLPHFTLGRLAYFHQPALPREQAGQPLRSPRDLAASSQGVPFNDLERAKLLETLLRATPADVWPGLSLRSPGGMSGASLLAVLRRLFDEVALSPHTGFIDSALRFLHVLEADGLLTTADVVDFVSYLLRHIARHLTAYDLVTFHHQGANYPDALLLDAALKDYLERIERAPDLFMTIEGDDSQAVARKRMRRRAMRQGWLLRRFYEGLPVPDAPTSPGENARVLPPPYARVPEEQIVNREKRTKRLFDADPLPRYLGERGREVLEASLRDLIQPAELRELGLALFLDRPFGIGKPPTEPDQTLLVSYEAVSRAIAQRRIRYLADDPALLTSEERDVFLGRTRELPLRGVPLPLTKGPARPVAVSLDDARKVAPDFVFLRTTRRSLAEVRGVFDFSEIERRVAPSLFASGRRWLLIRDEGARWLALYDADGHKEMQLRVRDDQGYVHRGGYEYPAAGLEAHIVGHVFNVPLLSAL